MMTLRLYDRILLVLSLGAAVVSGIFMYDARGSAVVVIESEGAEWRYPLDRDAVIEVPGKIGITVIEIHGGAVRIVDSPCPLHTCVAHGAVRDAGMPLVCLPNAVCVSIRGNTKRKSHGTLDAVSY